MYFDEIKGWRDGAKIRLKTWNEDQYWFKYQGTEFRDQNGLVRDITLTRVFDNDDWEPYVEPKKPNTITMYRYTYKTPTLKCIEQTNWTDSKFLNLKENPGFELLKTETKEVTFDE